MNRADICRGKRGCQALVCDACHVQSRRGQLRDIAQRLRGAASVPVLARSSQRARAIVASDADASAAAAAAAPPEVPPVVPAAEEAAAAVDASLLERASEAAGAVYRLSRPHTIRGTLLACFTGIGRALIESPSFVAMLPALLPRAMLGVLALLLGNLFIVGINQIYDVDIDVVNKPYLPIAAGRLSPKAAWGIVLGSGAAALSAAFHDELFMNLTVVASERGRAGCVDGCARLEVAACLWLFEFLDPFLIESGRRLACSRSETFRTRTHAPSCCALSSGTIAIGDAAGWGCLTTR